jgi:NAD(P)-dependent dehydrogenase (short-subunit alcohol dehydrogenase family)
MSTLAFITGANKGIGLEVARQLGATGIIVLIGARDTARADAAVTALKNDGINAHPVEIDVNSEASVIAAAKKIANDHGRIDILVNNAGIMTETTAGTRPKDLTLDTLKQTFETNVFGAFAVIKHFVPLLKRSRAPRIINVSSTLGSLTAMSDRAHPMHGVNLAAFSASKSALNALTVALAKDLAADRITVNSVCPGWIKQDMGGECAPRNATQGASIVVTLATSGNPPTGTFVDENGSVAW